MIDLTGRISTENLREAISRVWTASAGKLRAIHYELDPSQGAPVFTVNGKYTSRGWTEWTQGFQFGSNLLQFDGTSDEEFLTIGRESTVSKMAHHLTHIGVHDHGFNNVSTYGSLLRMMNQGRIPENEWERNFYELALKVSGAVQASRWTSLGGKEGYVYSFNGPHSLFSDTIRSMRSLAVSHQLGHSLGAEHDERVSLLDRLIQHAEATARYNVYYGTGRDGYDIRGRVVHESIFNTNDGQYRCPSTQQGYTPFSTWTRGLAWVMCGFPEQLEFLATRSDDELEPSGGREFVEAFMLKAARAACDFYIEYTPSCGVPYWDTGAPNLHKLGSDYLDKPADPFNPHEPVDSSAAAIAAQGLLRLASYLKESDPDASARYRKAGLRTFLSLSESPYLDSTHSHHGLLLHSVYHWPNRWDNVPAGRSVAAGEATMWGDYHLREVTLYLQKEMENASSYTFFL